MLLAGGGDRATTGSCGAFAGALMALGACFSPRADEPPEQEMAKFNKTRLTLHGFRDWFIAECGGVTCADVQRHEFGRIYNFMDANDQKEFAMSPETRRKCFAITIKAAFKVSEMLLNKGI
ncbi:MAG: hypothetical protein CSYNP_00640 [Syntrophus sp. SKADARSKE-3]|nr:hypothetical protein [Syntrophus sp. SKADARSKE-3]